MSFTVWLGICIIAGLTFLTRFAPLVLNKKENSKLGEQSAWLEALGPCLLASMALVILFPTAKDAVSSGTLLPFIGGVTATSVIMLFRRDGGLAVLFGVVTWWIIQVSKFGN
jgi:branched-subunit amino acid transport protein